MNRLLLTNAHLVTRDDIALGSLYAEDGLIRGIDTEPAASPQAIDLGGDLLIAGLIELHTDNLERHLMPRPGVHWALLPALLAHDAEIAAAGITTVLDAIGVGEADTDSLRGQDWNPLLSCLSDCRARGVLRADHLLHVRCELPAPNTIGLFTPFHNHPLLKLISLMDHTPGQRQWENIDHARIYYTGKKGWSETKFQAKVAQASELQDRYARPHRAYFVDYAKAHGITLASHDDTTPDHVAQACDEGVRISEFPTTVAAAQAARDMGLSTVMGGPNVVRGGSHSGNVAAAELARLGLLDILSSDYVPGSLLSAVFTLHRQQGIALPQAVGMVTHQPATALNLNDRGQIAPGLRADLVQVHPITLHDGSVHPVVRAVWREGRRVL
ncbi:MAG: alpha-D-ribose 1-methylphosphonate 5-triphosphate diphosphatase [Thiomonas sp.]|uniref:alpha-D-ribose 1-methylphosphonate 5-triphosphate diphosphatase n=1 Tax=Thiomonas sp. TaxID=2047785 RepID=UPI002A35ACAB|nr:alpha-D-ribose 1-methylphosphonate 5-triphosphate diphosphatase [Thiomonas sp.]MDY0329967.1 alpha-D-ribose 1-methylphosphonate 5-triphosphate diphosphatase [Thiomonas sp.]